jgi:hypothetical protein
MARRVKSIDFGIDGRIVAGLAGLTLLAAGLGFVVASGANQAGGRQTAAVAAPAPSLSPEAIDPEATTTTTATVPSPPSPHADPPVATPSVATPAVPTTTAPTTTTPPTTATTPPPPPVQPPAADPGDLVPFRPEAASRPLAEFLVPAGALPGDTATATTALRAAQTGAPTAGTTRADIGHVLELDRRFADARLAGRRETVSRTVRLNAWWYAHKRAPTARVLVRDPDGFIYSYAPGHGFALNPVATAGRWQRLNEGFTSVQLATALLSLGVAEIRGGRQTLSWEYYDIADQPTAIRPGVSAMAQSRVAQLLASAYKSTGDVRFVGAAVDAMALLAVDVSAGGTRSLVAYPTGSAAAPWFVERAYPGEDPWKGAALNGLMVSLIELRSAERLLREPASGPSTAGEAAANEARRLADEGAATLDRYLPAHDTGKWSYYGLLTPGHAFRTYLASATYHCYHITLLRSLAPLYPALQFGAYADKWAGYARQAGTKCPGTTPIG